MLTLRILDYNFNFVANWSWLNGKPIPNKGDALLIHFGDDNECEYRVNVLRREFDGTNPDVVYIVTDYVAAVNRKDDEDETL